MTTTVFETRLDGLELAHRGKVRDVYRIDDDRLLIVASDRLSAFDVVLPDPIPGKGCVLTQISNFWFGRTRSIVPNHLLDSAPEAFVPNKDQHAQLEDRTVVVRALKALPIEAVVRGYLIGSGWKDYRQHGSVCGIALPAGLELADRLPQPVFTPATKAAAGEHDENIDFARCADLLGRGLAQKVRDTALTLYKEAAEYALARGIIIADTKFEFGLADDGELILIDEALTPDSSRFWPADSYRPGSSPASFDKQYVRDYLETLDWDKTAPGPHIPAAVIERTAAKYLRAMELLTAAK